MRLSREYLPMRTRCYARSVWFTLLIQKQISLFEMMIQPFIGMVRHSLHTTAVIYVVTAQAEQVIAEENRGNILYRWYANSN